MSTVTLAPATFAPAKPAMTAPINVPTTAATRAPRLRLTKRGRGVLTSLVALPLVVAAFAFALNGGVATATVEGSTVPLEYVTIGAGETMWQLALDIAPDADPRDVIAEVLSFNQLQSSVLKPGQQLALPPEYSN